MILPVSPAPSDASLTWWRRNRGWLVGALLLGVLALWLPYRNALREFVDTRKPSHPIDVPLGAWGDYEGSRWRVIRVQREDMRDGSAGYQHSDSSLVVVTYEVMRGRNVTSEALDRCNGRLSDQRGRYWRADAMVHSQLPQEFQRLGRDCGSRMGKEFLREKALPARPFEFHHLFQIPRDLPTPELRGEIAFPPFTTTPPGSYLRFNLG
jgi:hypothetical protein